MTPAFEILADDKRITDLIRDRLLSLRVTDEDGYQTDTLEITLDNRQLKIIPPATGAELRVSLGYMETGVRPMGLFVVDEYERSGLPHQIIIRARSAWGGSGKSKSATVSGITTALKEQRSRSWDGQTLGAIVSQIAAECGLEPRIDADLEPEAIAHIDQTDEGNANFLRRLAHKHGAVFKPAGGMLIFVKKVKGKTVSEKEIPRVHLTRERGLVQPGWRHWVVLSGDPDSYRLTVAEREDFKSVIATWHDVAAAERKEVRIGRGDPARRMRGNYASAVEAAQAADAEYRRIGRGKAQPTFNCEGYPLLAAEGILVVDDSLGSDLEGDWVITRAEHTLDVNGYRTSLECESSKAV